ncbi:hypothetical protein QBC45DRAFT_340281 [Copromyces sp. CBS 386.78]|nr:hypothetical protein QBC45DRAFT_340281 [Copromyces sp. CBS 386.78]
MSKPGNINTALIFPSSPTQLSPELKLYQAVGEFAQALDGEKKQDFMRLQARCAGSPPTAFDVIRMTEKLNREGARRHAAWTPAPGTRLGGFLGRIQKFAEAGDVLIGGTQSLIASGVWTAVRVSLEAAVGHYAYFDQVSSLLMRITQSWEITLEFAKHFPDSAELQAFLAEYLVRVVQLCKKIMLVAKRPPYLLLAASIFSSFDTEFKPLEEELDKLGTIIQKHFDVLVAKAAQEQQVAIKDAWRLLRRIHKTRKRQDGLEQQQRILHILSPRQPQIDAIWRRERKRGTPNWMLNAPEYKAWKRSTKSVLRITGHFGCGKTVALASIISDAIMENKKCAGFICKKDDPNTLEGLTILGSIAHQLLQSSAARQDWEAMIQRNPSLIVGSMATSSIVQLLQSMLPQNQAFYVVLDGLQECAKQEVEVVFEALHDLRKSHQLSVCFSTTLDGLPVELTEEYLGIAHVLSLNSSQRDDEIGRFIRTEVRKRNAVRQPPLNSNLENVVTEALTLGAQGMYLWVSLHLEAIFPSHSDGILTDESVLNILNHLPHDLPQAFDQALGRISDLRYGDRIFQLVAVAESPLTSEQLNVALNVQPGNNIWNETKLPRSTKQVVARCGGGLLEVDEEDNCVRFIHHSVVSHMGGLEVGIGGRSLTRSWISDAEAYMGSVCVTYLNFRELDRRMVLHRNVDPISVSEALKKEVSSYNPVLTRVVRHIKGDKRRPAAAKQLNIFPILLDLNDRKTDPDIMTCFLPYATKHWLQHTAHLGDEDDANIGALWGALVDDRPPHISIPWSQSAVDQGGMLEYALIHSHAYLYRFVMRSVPEVTTFLSKSTRYWTRGLKKDLMQKDQATWQTEIGEMINRCLVAGPSFIPAAYYCALIQDDLEDDVYRDALNPTMAVSERMVENGRYDCAIRMVTDFLETKSANMTRCLWAVVEHASAGISINVWPEGVRKALRAALRVLALRQSLPASPPDQNSDFPKDAFWRSLDALSEDGDGNAFRILWKYRLSVANWGGEGQYLESLALRNAFDHQNINLVRMIAANLDVESYVFEQRVGHAKQRAESMIFPKLHPDRLMDPMSYVWSEEHEATSGLDFRLSAVQVHIVNNNYDEALDLIQSINAASYIMHKGLKIPHYVVQQRIVLRWIIDHRSAVVFRRLPFLLREVILHWPTVLLYTITTYAREEPPSTEVADNERDIFFRLFKEMSCIRSHDNPAVSFNVFPDVGSGWTELHAAACWKPFAVKALLQTCPEWLNETRLGYTPLVAALAGRLEEKDTFATVELLLKAGADIEAPSAFPHLSPLDISIAHHRFSVSQLMVEWGCTSSILRDGTGDIAFHALLKMTALLESRMAFQGDGAEWARKIENVTSFEDHYSARIWGATPLDLADIPLPPDRVYELEGCDELHSEAQDSLAGSHCNCAKHHRGKDLPPPDPIILAKYESIIEQAYLQRRLDEEVAMVAED